jgi:negative regulator of sigma-B (phosphoserine phosphatase)
MQFGVINQASKGQTTCGDAYFIKEFENKVFIAVIDGLGHGDKAAAAANTAVEHIKNNNEKSLTEIIKGCHEKMKKTRGAVIGIALIDLDRSILRCAGVGNVEIRVRSRTTLRPVSTNGILGYNLRKVREKEFSFNPGDLIILHSDGISGKFDLDMYPPEFLGQHPQIIAERIAAEFGRRTDDLTIVVARQEKREV